MSHRQFSCNFRNVLPTAVFNNVLPTAVGRTFVPCNFSVYYRTALRIKVLKRDAGGIFRFSDHRLQFSLQKTSDNSIAKLWAFPWLPEQLFFRNTHV